MTSTDTTRGKLQQDLYLIIHQYLVDNNLTETANRFVEESKLFFDLEYFESLIRAGEWEQVKRYALNWLSWDGEQYAKKTIFTVMKQMYLEALARKDYKTAIRMLYHDLAPLKTHKLETWQQLFDLLALEDFRENPKLSSYTTDEHQRELVILELSQVIERAPNFRALCVKPLLPTQKRLNTLVNQALNWQHSRCGVKDADWFNSVDALQIDHRCVGSTSVAAEHPATQAIHVSPQQAKPKPTEDGHTNGANGVKRGRETISPATTTPPPKHTKHDVPSPALSPIQAAPTTPMIQRHEVEIPPRPSVPSMPSVPSVPSTPTSMDIVPPSMTREQAIASLPVQDITHISLSSPAAAVRFHPVQSTLLYVATTDSQLQVWNVSQSIVLQFLKVQSPITRIAAAADGSFIACSTQSKVLVFSAQSNGTLEQIHVLSEHTAEVNDIKLFKVKDNWHVLSCSDDKTIIISNAVKGEKVVQFTGHEGPVTAIAHGNQGRMVFLCSSSKDSTIRVWMLSQPKPVSSLTSPSSKWYTDLCIHDTKLFGCGVARDLLEWSTSGGNVSKHFRGYNNASETSIVKFELLNRRFLVLSDDSSRIKFWDINEEEPLLSFDPEILGSSSSYLSISGNGNGSLLAIGCPNAHYVKITGNADGIKQITKKLSKKEIRADSNNNNNNNVNVTPSRPPKPSVQIPTVQAAHSPAAVQSPIAPAVQSLPVTSVNLTQTPATPTPQQPATPIPQPPTPKPQQPATPTPQPPSPAVHTPAPVPVPAASPVPEKPQLIVSTVQIPKSSPSASTLPPLIPSTQSPLLQSSFNMLSVKAESDPEAPINQLIFQNNGGGLITFGDGAIRLWKWPTGQQANSLTKPDNFTTSSTKFLAPPLPTTGPRFYSLALTSNDIYLMASSGNGVTLFHTTKLQDFGHTVPGLALSAMTLNTRDNNYLATIAADAVRVHAFGYDPGVVLELRSLFTSKPTCVAFHNNFIAAGSDEGLLVIYKLNIVESEKVSPQGKKFNVKSFSCTEEPRQFNMKHPIISLSVNKANNILLVVTKKTLVFVSAPEQIVYIWENTFSSNIVAATFNVDCTMIFCALEDNVRIVLKVQGTADSPQDLAPVRIQPLDNKHGAIRCIAAHTRSNNVFAVGTQKGFFCICEFDPKKD